MTSPSIRAETVSFSTLLLNLLIISGAWGSSFLFVKLIAGSMPPFAFAAASGFISMAALLMFLAIRGREPRSDAPSALTVWKNIGHMIVLGTTNGWLAKVLMVVAVTHVDTALAALSQALVPLMVAVMAHHLLVSERLRINQLIGILIGLAGILLIIGPIAVVGGRGSLIGIGATLLTAVSYACGIVYGRRVAARDPAVLACGQQACGAAIGAVISLIIEPTTAWGQPAGVWLLLVIVDVICSALPTFLYLRLLAKAASVPAALVAYLQPVWAMLLGWAVLAEQIGSQALFGAGIVIVGIVISARRPISRPALWPLPVSPDARAVAKAAGRL